MPPLRKGRNEFTLLRKSRSLTGARHLQQLLSCSEICVLICLRLGGKGPICCPQVDERLHWFELSRLEQIKSRRCQDEMGETTVQLLFEIEVIERFSEVRPIQMSIDAEHLSKNHLAHFEKLVGKARSLAQPVWLCWV